MKKAVLPWLVASMTLVSAAVHAEGFGKEPRPAGFGDRESTVFANRLWTALEQAGLTGPGSTPGAPFLAGSEPHGRILEIFRGQLTVAGHRGDYRLKRSYDRPGATTGSVAENPARFLSFYTVMFRREPGYDPANNDWYWAKFQPDGSVARRDVGGQSRAVAGRVSRRADGRYGGCLYCHRSAGSGDYTFYPEHRFVEISAGQ